MTLLPEKYSHWVMASSARRERVVSSHLTVRRTEPSGCPSCRREILTNSDLVRDLVSVPGLNSSATVYMSSRPAPVFAPGEGRRWWRGGCLGWPWCTSFAGWAWHVFLRVQKIAGSVRLGKDTLRNEESGLRLMQRANKCAFSRRRERREGEGAALRQKTVVDVGYDDEGRSRRGYVRRMVDIRGRGSRTNNAQLRTL